MKAARFSEEQIIAILREQEAGIPALELCRKHGISSPTFYKWKAKYGGMQVSEARRLKSLDDGSRPNVSGLSRVGFCCSQAMMRSARFVLR
jgi:transposase-like protein